MNHTVQSPLFDEKDKNSIISNSSNIEYNRSSKNSIRSSSNIEYSRSTKNSIRSSSNIEYNRATIDDVSLSSSNYLSIYLIINNHYRIKITIV